MDSTDRDQRLPFTQQAAEHNQQADRIAGRRMRLFANPGAGAFLSKDMATLLEEIASPFKAAGHAVELPETDWDFAQAMDWALAAPLPDVLLVCGGDGTVLSLAEKLFGTETALGVIPMGTINLLARDLGLAMDGARAAQQLAGGVVEEMDVGCVNDRIFLCSFAFGMFQALARAREEVRTAPDVRAWRDAVSGFVRSVRTERPFRVRIEFADRERRLESHFLVVSNNPYSRDRGFFLNRGVLDSGRLGIYAHNMTGRLGSLAMMTRMLFSAWHDRDRIDDSCSTFTIHTDPPEIDVAIDGELEKLAGPFKFSMKPRALCVLRPQLQDRR